MPLQSGKSKDVVSGNIEELLHAYKQRGKIGATSPRSIKHAQRIAAAIAFRKARGGRKRKRGLREALSGGA